MSLINRVRNYIDNNSSMNTLVRLLLVACIFFIIYNTSAFWYTAILKIWHIIRPFVFGFAVAYIFDPLVKCLNKIKISKKVSIPIIFIVLISAFVMFFVMIIPLLYTRIMEFFNTIYINIEYITTMVSNIDNPQLLAFVNNMIEQISISIDTSYRELLVLSLSTNVSNVVKIFMDIITLAVFTMIISVYMLVDFDRIKNYIRNASRFINNMGPKYMSEIDDDLQVYIKSVLVLMLIKFVEYSLLYYVLGHPDFWLLGVITALGLVVPYFGAMFANIIGVLTILHMGFGKVLFLLIAMLILSNIDAYVIAPLVHAKRSTLSPLWILFSIFIGGYVAGMFGILIAVPMLITVKSIINTYIQINEKPEIN